MPRRPASGPNRGHPSLPLKVIRIRNLRKCQSTGKIRANAAPNFGFIRPAGIRSLSLDEVTRFDAGLFSQAGKTPVGGLRLRAHIARTGVQIYRMPDGSTRREYRPAEEVGSANSLASYAGAPITIGHPKLVTPQNFEKVSAGHVSSAPSLIKRDSDDYVEAFLDVNRLDALDAVVSGELVELSAGYRCDFDPTAGLTPQGQPYDGVQRNIKINHVALLPAGKARAGRKARIVTDEIESVLRLDSNGNQVDTDGEDMSILIGGKPLEGVALQAAVCALETEAATSKAALAVATTKVDEAEKSAATAEGKLVLAEAAKVAAEAKISADAIDALVSDELAFRAAAAPILDTADAPFDFKGKSRRDVKCLIVKAKLNKDLAITDSDARVDALYEVSLEAKAVTADKGEDYSKREPASKNDSADVVLDASEWDRKLSGLFKA